MRVSETYANTIPDKPPIPSFPQPFASRLGELRYQNSLTLYEKAIRDNTKEHSDGVTIYTGGPLDYESRDQPDEFSRSQLMDSWLTPILVDGTIFHLLELNIKTYKDVEPKVYFVPVSDSHLMLNADTEYVRMFNELLDGNNPEPRRIVRVCTNGNLLFGKLTDPTKIPSAEVLGSRLAKVIQRTGIMIPATNEDLIEISKQKKHPIEIPDIQLDGFQILEPELVNTPEGDFYVYGVIAENDPWEYYELLSPLPLSEMDFSREIVIRLDSGCSTGQCYGDELCDCAKQLHDAMALAQRHNGLVLSSLNEDGRGFGLVTKLITEAGKHGITIDGYNNNTAPMTTDKAAEALLGDMYDIRTYGGMSRFLRQIGVKKVILFSDNADKAEALSNSLIEVHILQTETELKSPPKVAAHVEAKHKSITYFKTPKK